MLSINAGRVSPLVVKGAWLFLCLVSRFCVNSAAACSAAVLKSGVVTPGCGSRSLKHLSITGDVEAESRVLLPQLAGANVFLQVTASKEVPLILVGVRVADNLPQVWARRAKGEDGCAGGHSAVRMLCFS